MEWYLAVLKNYAGFSGRARRKEYWMYTLFNIIIAILLMIMGRMISILSILSVIYALATIIPGIAVFFRRLHDTNRSGWWWLIGFIPFIGAIILLIFMIQDSTPGENRYGPNPKETAEPV